jgi:hypothetical protein
VLAFYGQHAFALGTTIALPERRRCWTSRPDLGERWPARLVATAEEDRLNIRAQSVPFFCVILGDTEVGAPV